MTTLYITEFDRAGRDALGVEAQVARVPSITTQTVTISGTSAQSSAFNASTTLVRLHATVGCSVLFGLNPTATTSNMRLGPGQTEYFCVQANSGLKVAVISNS